MLPKGCFVLPLFVLLALPFRVPQLLIAHLMPEFDIVWVAPPDPGTLALVLPKPRSKDVICQARADCWGTSRT